MSSAAEQESKSRSGNASSGKSSDEKNKGKSSDENQWIFNSSDEGNKPSSSEEKKRSSSVEKKRSSSEEKPNASDAPSPQGGSGSQTGKKRTSDGRIKPSSSSEGDERRSSGEEERPSDECQERFPPAATPYRHDGREAVAHSSLQQKRDEAPSNRFPHLDTSPVPCDSVRLTSSKGSTLVVDWVTFHAVIVKMFSPAASCPPASREKRAVLREWTGRARGNNISDGYKWRKYGQKLLTASKLHREYLRCTFPGCPARKHIEVVPATREVVAVSSSKHNHPPLTATNDQSPKSDGIVSEPEKNEASEKLGADEKHGKSSKSAMELQ